VQIAQRRALGAQEALAQDVGVVAADAGDPALGDPQREAAARFTERTDPVRHGGHLEGLAQNARRNLTASCQWPRRSCDISAHRISPRSVSMSLIFYYSPMSTAVATHWVLEELKIPYEKVKLDLQAGGTKKPDFLKINPNGVVPAIVHDGTAIFESA